VGQWLAGRTPGIHLNEAGCEEARILATRLGRLPIAALYSSPLERALETAEPLAQSLGLTVQAAPGLTELDFGEWTGRTLRELAPLALWQQFNTQRSATRIPGGELMSEVVARARRELEGMEEEHRGAIVAAVTHGDVIRGLLAEFLGLSLDQLQRLEVAPASVSLIRMHDDGAHVGAVNWQAGGLAKLIQSAI
jgi:probable phosphoglycerate mutase